MGMAQKHEGTRAPGPCSAGVVERPTYNAAVSKNDITYLVTAGAVVIGLGVYIALILRPAWTSYGRLLERIAAAFLSLYVLAVFIGIGVIGGLAAVYFWG